MYQRKALVMFCKHPPERLYCWFAHSLDYARGQWVTSEILCVACCACGEVLSGGIGEWEMESKSLEAWIDKYCKGETSGKQAA